MTEGRLAAVGQISRSEKFYKADCCPDCGKAVFHQETAETIICPHCGVWF